MKPNSTFHLSAGWSSVLMIFVVLCLTTFGMLSYVTANADNRISAKNAEAVQSYYQANNNLQSKLEQVDGALLMAKSDAKQAVDAGTLDNLKNKSVYENSSEIQSVLSGSLPNTTKYAECYRIFSQLLISQCSGVTVETTKDGDGTLNCSIVTDVDKNRRIQVKLTVSPYVSAERYRITSEKLVSTEEDGNTEETLPLWQGSSVGK